MRRGVFHDGTVHVMAGMCSTCIFRPGNLMHLRSGRLRDMVATAHKSGENGHVVCHETLDGPHAACRGYLDAEPCWPPLFQVAQRLGYLTEVQPRT